MNVGISSELRCLSLCTGGGGLDLGLKLAIPDCRTVLMLEREAFAVAHLVQAIKSGLLDDCPIWSDVTTFRGRPWRGVVDFVFGGIPCQPHSLAGKREGEDDERDLWSDARRIIVQVRPRVVLIENVPGMLTAKSGLDPGAKRVWRDLQRLGYEVEGGLFTASEVGANHKRERVFILGVANASDDHWRGGERGAEAGTRSIGSGRGGPAGSGSVMADASGAEWRPLERGGVAQSDRGEPGRGEAAGRPQLCREELADAQCDGRGQGTGVLQPRPDQSEPACRGEVVADPDEPIVRGQPSAGEFGVDEPDPGHGPGLGGGDVANAAGQGPQGGEPGVLDRLGQRPTAERSGGGLVDAEGERRGEGLSEPELRRLGHGATGGAGAAVVHPVGGLDDRGPDLAFGGPQGRIAAELASGGPLHAPGPSDIEPWRAVLARWPFLEPAVRRAPDGMAPWLDAALLDRIDRLRLLGNGVVPIQAAMALKVLATRIARRSAGAAGLVRMMRLDDQP